MGLLQVRQRFAELGYGLRSVHEVDDAVAAVGDAEAIAVGGGNTFHLLSQLYETGLLEAVRTLFRLKGGQDK